MRGNDLRQAVGSIQINWIDAAIEMHGKQQSHQPEVMIAMQVTDEDVVELVMTDVEPA